MPPPGVPVGQAAMAANQLLPQAPVTIGVMIPGECIGRVIGKEGAGLKQIRESTGCKLEVAKTAGNNSVPRRLSITGSPHGVGKAAQQALLKTVADEALTKSVSMTVTVFIPPDLAGVVVGKAGANLKRVRESLAVRLEVDKESVNDERKVTMSGSWMNMGQALAMALGGIVPGLPFSSQGVVPHMLAIPTPQHSHSHMLGANASASSAGGGVDVRQVSADPEEIQLHMVVPDKLVGALLGREGSQIKQLGLSTGCKLCMTKKDMAERRVVMIGTYNQCIEAHRQLQQQLLVEAQKASIEVTLTTIIFYIRSPSAGAVIGKGGATLKRIRDQTLAKVQVEREEVHGQRPCIIRGTDEQVMQAVQMVHEAICDEAVRDEGDVGEVSGYVAEPVPERSMPASLIPTPALTISSGTGSALVTAKRHRVDGEGDSTKLLVPAKSAGAVIGKQGSGLKSIREQCGVKVEMLQTAQAPQWPEERVVVLQGLCESRRHAAFAVLQAAFPDPSSATLKMLVANGEAGAIIGRSGATLKNIREQCGISVQVEKNDILGERLVRAQGTVESLRQVADMIIGILDGQEVAPEVPPPFIPYSMEPAATWSAVKL